MSEDQAISLTATFGAMMLVTASLMSRRLPMRDMVRLGVVWLVIFAAGYGVVKAFYTS